MELKDILSISGAPGLYRYVAQGKGGIIVESLGDSRRQLIGGSAKVSALGDIAIFTDSDEVSLAQVLQNIYDIQKGEALTLNNKSDNQTLSTFMAEVLPNYDRERVHISDIKKLAAWYNILIGAGITKFVVEPVAEAEQVEAEASTETEASAEVVLKKAKAAKTTTVDQSAKKQAVKNAKPKASTASQPKVVTPKTTTNRKSS